MGKEFRNITLRTGIFVATTFFFTACGQVDKKKTEKTEVTDTIEKEEQIVETPKTADVSFVDKSGKSISLNDLKGKVVFINFWATWCPPCIHELPSINKLRQSFKVNDDIEFLMVDIDAEIQKSSAFMEENKYDLPVYIPNSSIPSNFLGDAIPTTVIIDKQGNLVTRLEGGRDYMDPEIAKGLKTLLEAK